VTGYSDMQLRRMERAGLFPKRFKLNPDAGKYGAAGHDYGEVMGWLAARKRSRRGA
jgi:predicted DNA-binding transcriptional regulator AlpA